MTLEKINKIQTHIINESNFAATLFKDFNSNPYTADLTSFVEFLSKKLNELNLFHKIESDTQIVTGKSNYDRYDCQWRVYTFTIKTFIEYDLKGITFRKINATFILDVDVAYRIKVNGEWGEWKDDIIYRYEPKCELNQAFDKIRIKDFDFWAFDGIVLRFDASDRLFNPAEFYREFQHDEGDVQALPLEKYEF